MLNVRYNLKGEDITIGLIAESIQQANEKSEKVNSNLEYVDYDEIEESFENQKILSICSKPVDELSFPWNLGKRLSLLLAYGTNCQCCLGYRILAGLVIGFVIGVLF